MRFFHLWFYYLPYGYFVFSIGIPTYSISDFDSVSMYIVIHFDFDDLMRLRMLQLMILISWVSTPKNPKR
jgi:hypothetical protein